MDAPKHTAICHELTELYCRKNKDYGDSYHETYRDEGWAAFRIRLTDKLNRFKTLTKDAAEVKDENIRDTLLDLANYAILAVMELDRDGEAREVLYDVDKAMAMDTVYLTEQERLIAAMLDAKYISRDNEDDAPVEFWKSKPISRGDFYYVGSLDGYCLAVINANGVHTRIKPGDCVRIDESEEGVVVFSETRAVT